MLVLSRKLNEEIVISGNIIVRVVGIGREIVRLGIEAPKEVAINRLEIQALIDREARRDGRTLGGGLGERNGEGA